jgi:hypothetical protein
MSKAPFENTWYHRKVAENATKPCNICFKPTASVLITPNNKVREMANLGGVLYSSEDRTSFMYA